LKELPKGSAAQEAIAEEMYNEMLSREEDGIKRLMRVVEFATADDCTFLLVFRAVVLS
jgi:hypothetical protein